jgi:hypothetical protein
MAEEMVRLPTRRPGLQVRQTETGFGLYKRSGRLVSALNETALAIWELCDGATEPAEMVEAVRVACGVPQEVAAADIDRTLAALTEAGLVVWDVGLRAGG